MSGEGKSVKDKFAEIDKYLEDYEESIGLSKRKYLNLKDNDIEHMTPDQANEVACDLSAYGLFLQKEINKQTSRISYANANLNKIIAAECNNVRAYSYEERKLIIINENEAARELDKFRLYAQMKADRLAYLPQKIGQLADKLKDMANGKRSKTYG